MSYTRSSYLRLAGLCLLLIVLLTLPVHLAAGGGEPSGVRIESDANEVADISGYYRVESQNEDDTLADGIAYVQKSGDLYLFRWLLGGAVTTGVGIRQKDNISVGWSGGGKNFGVTIYRVRSKRLDGVWSETPSGRIRRETMRRVDVKDQEESP